MTLQEALNDPAVRQLNAATQIANILSELSDTKPLIDVDLGRAHEILNMSEVFVADYLHDIGKPKDGE